MGEMAANEGGAVTCNKFIFVLVLCFALVVKLVNTADLKSAADRLAGSSPARGTNYILSVAQLNRAAGFYPAGWGFESLQAGQFNLSRP